MKKRLRRKCWAKEFASPFYHRATVLFKWRRFVNMLTPENVNIDFTPANPKINGKLPVQPWDKLLVVRSLEHDK